MSGAADSAHCSYHVSLAYELVFSVLRFSQDTGLRSLRGVGREFPPELSFLPFPGFVRRALHQHKNCKKLMTFYQSCAGSLKPALCRVCVLDPLGGTARVTRPDVLFKGPTQQKEPLGSYLVRTPLLMLMSCLFCRAWYNFEFCPAAFEVPCSWPDLDTSRKGCGYFVKIQFQRLDPANLYPCAHYYSFSPGAM